MCYWSRLPRGKCNHFDDIFVTSCTRSCHFDNFQWYQWWKFPQYDDISISVLLLSNTVCFIAAVQYVYDIICFMWHQSPNSASSTVAFINGLMKKRPGPWFNIKMISYQYRKSHCGDKMILRPSYLHNGISYTGKTTSWYWIRALVPT